MEFEPKQPVPESVVGLRNSRFPERVGRTWQTVPTALEIAATESSAMDIIATHRSVGNMDWEKA